MRLKLGRGFYYSISLATFSYQVINNDSIACHGNAPLLYGIGTCAPGSINATNPGACFAVGRELSRGNSSFGWLNPPESNGLHASSLRIAVRQLGTKLPHAMGRSCYLSNRHLQMKNWESNVQLKKHIRGVMKQVTSVQISCYGCSCQHLIEINFNSPEVPHLAKGMHMSRPSCIAGFSMRPSSYSIGQESCFVRLSRSTKQRKGIDLPNPAAFADESDHPPFLYMGM